MKALANLHCSTLHIKKERRFPLRLNKNGKKVMAIEMVDICAVKGNPAVTGYI